jgi:hypothetical protein
MKPKRTDNAEETAKRMREYEAALEAGLTDARAERDGIAEAKKKIRADALLEWERWTRPRRRMADVFARVGTSSAKNMKWLLAFRATRPGNRPDFAVLDQVTAFAFLAFGIPPKTVSKWETPDHRGTAVVIAEGVPVGLAAAWKQVVRLHAVVAQAIDTLIATGRFRLPAVPISLEIEHKVIYQKWRQAFPHAKDHAEIDPAEYRILPPDHPRSLFTLFVSRLGAVLSVAANSLWTCAVCGRAFSRVRSDARHCSNACRSRVNMRAYRERLGKRRKPKGEGGLHGKGKR